MDLMIAAISFITSVAGRQLTWLYAGGVGFMFGHWLSGTLQLPPPDGSPIPAGLTGTILFLMLTFYFRRFATVVAGGLTAAYLSFYLPLSIGADTTWFNWQVAAIAGILGALAIAFFYDVATIAITTTGGSTLFAQTLQIKGIPTLELLVALFIIGLVSQFLLQHYSPPDLD